MQDKKDKEGELKELKEKLEANPDIAWNDDGTATLRLGVPLKWGEDKPPIAELHIRRPKAKDRNIFSGKDPIRASNKFLSRLCGLTEAQVEELDAYDCDVGGDIALFFMGTSGRTGRSGLED